MNGEEEEEKKEDERRETKCNNDVRSEHLFSVAKLYSTNLDEFNSKQQYNKTAVGEKYQ